MNTTFYCIPKNQDLIHYGVKGMKWGVRKQNSVGDRGSRNLGRAKKVAIGVGAVALVAGVSYLALTRTDTGMAAISLGKSAIQRTINGKRAIYEANRSNPGRSKANYLPKTMRKYEKLARSQARTFAKKDVSDVYERSLNLSRSRNNMYALDGTPNFTKKTMRNLEAMSRSTAKSDAADAYAKYYKLELERARRMNYMYHK